VWITDGDGINISNIGHTLERERKKHKKKADNIHDFKAITSP
jgi:hypothetical protein